MRDRLFLAWLYNKLVNEGHDPNVDYMGKLRSIIKATPPDQLTPAPSVPEIDEAALT